jgi:trimeric autotransporter adhesin
MKPKHLSNILPLIVVLAMLLTAFIPTATVAADSPSITLDYESGVSGDAVEVTGANFTASYSYYIFFEDRFLKKGTIDSDGEFSLTIIIPSGYDVSTYTITVYASEVAHNSPNFNDSYDEEADTEFSLEESNIDITVELSPDSGKAGDTIKIFGSNFTQSYYYYVFFDEGYKGKGTVGSSGKFTRSITIPSDVEPGVTYVISVSASENSNSDPEFNDSYDEGASADFEVDDVKAVITLDTNSGKVGDTFNLTGSNFGPGKNLTVYWDTTKIDDTTLTASSSGGFTSKAFKVPETYFGPHTLNVVDSSGTSSTNLTYTVNPGIVLDSNTVTGSTITLLGNGFKASTDITFYIDNTPINKVAKTSANGTLSSTSLTIPPTIASGSHVIKAQDVDKNSASANFSIPAPVQTTTSTSTSTSTQITISTTTSQPVTTQTSTIPVSTSTTAVSTATQTSTPTPPAGFPVWAIIVCIVMLIAIVVIIVFIVKRKS